MAPGKPNTRNANLIADPRIRRLVVLTLTLFGLLGGGLALAASASAHASVVTSTPQDGARLPSAPKSVTIVFDEDVSLGSIGYLHVTNGNGKRVDAGPAFHPSGDGTKVTDTLQPNLGNGSYTASFRIISADSHPVAGTIAFVVGNGALVRTTSSTSTTNGTTAAAFDVFRWLSYAGFALLGGAWLLLTVWPEGRDDRRARGVVWLGWGACVAGAVLEALTQGPYAEGGSLAKLAHWSLLDDTLHTTYGQLHGLRLVLLGALALLFARSLQADARPAPWEGAAALLGGAIAYTFSAAGHPGQTSPTWVSVPIDMIHLLSMAAWIGGLVVIAGCLLPRREPAEIERALPVFSTVAFASVVLLAASGTYNAFRGIGTVDAILTTTYGLLVVAKIVLLLGILAVANLSRKLVRRRLPVAYAMTDTADPAVATEPETTFEDLRVERLRRSVLVEATIALIVLALTAVLVSEPKGKEAIATQHRKPVSATAPLAAGRTLDITADPGVHGNVTITVTLGAGATPTSVTATATQHAKQLGPLPVKLTKDAALAYSGTVALPVAGAWEIDLVISTSRYDATTTDATLHLH